MSQQNHIAEESMYFPPIRTALTQNPRLFRNLRLRCMICECDMKFRGDGHPAQDVRRDGFASTHGVLYPQDIQSLRPTHDAEVAIVLPCGHIFCKECLFAICYDGYGAADFNSNVQPRKANPMCPACRKKLCFDECGFRCRIPGIPFPSSPAALEVFQPTLPEGLPGLPPKCNSCLLLRCQLTTQQHIHSVLSQTMPHGGPARLVDVYTTILDEERNMVEPYMNRTFDDYLEQMVVNARAVTALRPWCGPAVDRRLRFILRWRQDFV